MKKRLIVLFALIIAALPVIWFYPALQSYVVMSIYSETQNKSSVMRDNGFAIEMAAGEGWYPFVLTYNATGFFNWSGIRADMSILYGFGAFDAATRTSSLYDCKSDLYSAFYGAYAIKKNDGMYGFFNDGTLNLDEIIKAVEYDYTQLVLRGFGCENPVFIVEEFNTKSDIIRADSGGWTSIDAKMRVNGAAHNYKENKTAYLQYGRPAQPANEDFALITMTGRVYAKHFEEYGCTVMLYVMAEGLLTVDGCDNSILAKTVIAGL
ncbi:MAG: hypothetical protein WDA65_07480 [Christensenellales bacterium]